MESTTQKSMKVSKLNLNDHLHLEHPIENDEYLNRLYYPKTFNSQQSLLEISAKNKEKEQKKLTVLGAKNEKNLEKMQQTAANS